MEKKNPVLITGAAGFIGFHLSKHLLDQGCKVVGFDNVNEYYDVNLKYSRLDILKDYPNFTFVKGELADKVTVDNLFATHKPKVVVNLAAQAGVRYSITNPQAYIDSNIVGFFNVLEACRHSEELYACNEQPWGHSNEQSGLNENPSINEEKPSDHSEKPSGYRVEHLLYASSSSVYGNQEKTPFSTDDDVSHPISLYAATKKSNELMAYTYSHLYGIPTTGLRFFTVYGPYGRPDMAYFSFTQKIIKGETIQIFNNGDMKRDFTYVDDIVQGIVNMLDKPPVMDRATAQDGTPAMPEKQPDGLNMQSAELYKSPTGESHGGANPARVYNIGNNKPEDLLHFVETLEKCLMAEGLISAPAKKEFLPMQPGDVYQTYADVSELMRDFDFKPATPIEEGLSRFAKWCRSYYG